MLHDYGSDSGQGYSRYLSNYWELELRLADHHCRAYSDLEKYQNAKDRTCGLCGLVVKTNWFGFVDRCPHQVCKSARDYWKMPDFLHPIPLKRTKTEADKEPRGTWFRKQLMDKFGVGQIYRLPIGQRLDVVLALQLLRDSIEAKREHETTSGNPVAAIGKSEPRRQEVKAGNRVACA